MSKAKRAAPGLAEEKANKAGVEQRDQAVAGAPLNVPAPAEGPSGAKAGISITGTASESARGRRAGGIGASEAETRMLQIPAGGDHPQSADRALPAAGLPTQPGSSQMDAGEPSTLSRQEAIASPSPLTKYTIQGCTPVYHAKWRVGRRGSRGRRALDL